MLETPVALLIFNRPETTARVFAEIARAKPKRLLVVADGPRSDEEAEKCAAARAIIERVDWDCDVLTNFSEVNLGCGIRPATGIHWIFENCEEAIILEDDCLPHPTFFRYCMELLDYYREDERVMAISGNNFQKGNIRGSQSYFFSHYPYCWGWATWKRAWQYYDYKIALWQQVRDTSLLADLLGSPVIGTYWAKALDTVFNGKKADVWDYQWMFTCWIQHGLAILPNVNLVSNIGFGSAATHTKEDLYGMANLDVGAIEFPLAHPSYVIPDFEADRFAYDNFFAKETYHPGFPKIVLRRIFDFLPTSFQEKVLQLRARN
jgi:hypothetical protein